MPYDNSDHYHGAFGAPSLDIAGMENFDFSDIRRAAQRLQGHIVRTPLLSSPMLDAAAGCNLFVKAESLQRTGAFKFRGALNKLLTLTEDERAQGILAFSSGNHGHAVAAAAHHVGCTAVIVLPKGAAKIKVENCRWWGAEIVFFDPETENREAVGRRVAEERGGLTVVPPFDDYAIIAGQGTCGIEICEQMQERNIRPDAVLINSSGGGLSSGVTAAVKAICPEADCYIVEPVGFEKMARSLEIGSPQANPSVPKSIMDAITGPIAGTRTFSVLRQHAVKPLSVSDEEALVAMEAAFRMLKLVVEPGGAASLAAVLHRKADFAGKNVVVVCSGGNVDPEVFVRAITRA